MKDAPEGYRRNFVLLVANYVSFGAGLACFSSTTVMPVFLRHLTDSAVVIGLGSAIFPLGWMIPQVFSARLIAGTKQRKPFLVLPSLGSPAVFAALSVLLFAVDPARMGWLLPVFLSAIAVLALVDGTLGVPWLDFVGSAIPSRLRGRMMGLQEMLFAVSSVGVGTLVGYLLSDGAPPFPRNFAWLASSATAFFFVALLLFLPLHDPGRSAPTVDTRTVIPFWDLLRRILRTDHDFAHLVILRFLNSAASMALPFYILYATTELGLPASTAGFFISSQMIGSAIGSIVLGSLYDRHGSRLVLRLVTGFSLLVPFIALLTPISTSISGWGDIALRGLFALVFFLSGMGGTSGAATFIGYSNYLLDHSPTQDRPAYLGLFNTLSGPTALAGMIGGLLLEQTSYRSLFVATALILGLAQIVAYRLPEPRRRVEGPLATESGGDTGTYR